MSVNRDFWRGRRVLVTGHTGFKGTWLAIWLASMGANVSGLSLKERRKPSLFDDVRIINKINHNEADIRDCSSVNRVFSEVEPEIVFHLAAQSLVRESYIDPRNTYEVNVIGTLNVFEAARRVKSIKAILNITSDKCYENKELSQSYRENDALGGFDPYSSSKACSEILTGCYRRSFFESQNVAVASARAGNVIGGGDWAKDRLIPDIIRSVLRGDDVELRYPESVRPWQHVIQPLHGYLLLVEKMFENPERYSSAWNFGPNIHDCRSAKWIAENLLAILNSSLKIIEKKEKTHHESRMLIIDSTKSRTELSWKPAWDIRKSLLMTGDWYIKSRAIENNLEELCLSQIESYARDVENGE